MASADGALVFKAGPGAYDMIRRDGFSPSLVGTLAGASGGAKWLVLSQIDRVLLRRLVPGFARPVFLLGSSIGAWRFACYAQRDPLAAIDRFEALYVNQRYSERPDIQEITRVSRAMLEEVLGPGGATEILAHTTLRTSIMTVRGRHLLGSERRPLLMTGLIAALLANAMNRRALGGFFSRCLFSDPRDEPPFELHGFPLDRVPLGPANLIDAIVASGSIPLVLAGVRDIAMAPRGTYRDGGVIDYHLDVDAVDEARITLFPHFFDWLKPGWFDKQLAWRRVDPANFDRTLLVCPSARFIASLPGGKVPDRSDFVRLPEEERISRWREVVERCKQLGDELENVLDRGIMPERLQPF